MVGIQQPLRDQCASRSGLHCGWTDFEGLADQLQSAEDETIAPEVLGWTHVAPGGWSIDNSAMPAQGTAEWQGWSFTTMPFWNGVAGQERDLFTRARGVFAVADPDEWDDVGDPSPQGFFDSTLISPAWPVAADDPITIAFN